MVNTIQCRLPDTGKLLTLEAGHIFLCTPADDRLGDVFFAGRVVNIGDGPEIAKWNLPDQEWTLGEPTEFTAKDAAYGVIEKLTNEGA